MIVPLPGAERSREAPSPMTRAAAVLAWVLAGVGLGAGVLELAADFAPGPLAGAAAALVVGVLGVKAWLRHRRAAVGMVLAVLPVLTRTLVLYFETYRPWPHLVLIVLSCLVFGLGLLGVFLDRFRPGPSPPSGTL